MKKNVRQRRKAGFLLLLAVTAVICLAGCSLGEKGAKIASTAKETASEVVDKIQQQTAGTPEPVAESDGVHLEYYFRQLSDEEKRVYREMLEGVLEFQADIPVSSVDNDAIERSYHALLMDHAELFWLHNGETNYKTIYQRNAEFTPAYGYTKEEAEAIQEGLEQAYREAAAGLPTNASQYETVRTVYEYLIRTVEYQTSKEDQNIAGSLVRKQAVCAGYARGVQYLLDRMGIECIYVNGDSLKDGNSHAWNIVLIDGQHYIVDATNGEQPQFLYQEEGQELGNEEVIYDYLCPVAQEYAAMYQLSQEFTAPDCTALEYNYYIRSQSAFTGYDWDALYGYCQARVDEGNTLIRFKYMDEEGFAQARAELIDQERIQDIARYYMEVQGYTEIEYHYGILEELKTIYLMF